MKKLSIGILSSVVAGFSVTANAGLLVDPIGKSEEGSIQVGVHYSSVTTAYKADCDGCDEAADIKKNGLTAYGAYGLNDVMDVYVGFTYNMTTEFDEPDSSGGESGFKVGGGIRGELLDLDSIKLVGYAQLAYISDDLSTVDTEFNEVGDLSASGFELSGGVLGILEVIDQVFLYGGLELVPFGNMKYDYEWTEYDYKNVGSVDWERDDMFAIRLGAKYMINDEMFIRGEFGAVGEKSFTIGAGTNF